MPDPVRFALILPEEWEVLDLDPATRDASTDRLLRRRIGGGDSLAPQRRAAGVAYRSLLHDAAEAGAFFAASTGKEVGGLRLAASVLAFLVPLPLGADGQPIGVDEMVTTLAEPEAEELREPPAVVELPVGRSVRVRGRMGAGVKASTGEEPRIDEVRFYVPMAEWGMLFVLVFSTPSLPAADAFAEVFDLLARTARWKVAS